MQPLNGNQLERSQTKLALQLHLSCECVVKLNVSTAFLIEVFIKHIFTTMFYGQ